MELSLVGEIVEKSAGRIRGQYIARASLESGVEVSFDVIEGILNVEPGDRIRIVIKDEGPSSEEVEKSTLCGHGYLVESEDRVGKSILSLWGILFVFSSKLGLRPNKKYYLCIYKV